MTTIWTPVFHMTMPCPGYLEFDRQSRQYETQFCHPSRFARGVDIKHGDLKFDVSMCDHVMDGYDTTACEELNGLFADLYNGFVHKNCTSPQKTTYAFKRGFSNEYFWDYSHAGICHSCDTCLTYESKSLRDFGGRYSAENNYYGNDTHKRFCSAECAALFTGLVCKQCGVGSEATITGEWFYYSCDLATKHDQYLEFGNYCSRECCSLAYEGFFIKQREELVHKENTKCVKEARKLTSKLKKLLRSHDSPEAWQSLKKEFEQVATSQ